MKIVTKKEFLDFIFAQDDEKKFLYAANLITDYCSCPMVEYGKFINLEFRCCTTDSWNYWNYKNGLEEKKVAIFESGFSFHDLQNGDISTYGELKRFLAKKNPEYLKN